MLLSDAVAIIHTIIAIGRVIQTITQEIAPIAADVTETLFRAGLTISNLKDTYVSNKHACTTMVNAVALLHADVDALNKRHSTHPPHLAQRVDAVVLLLRKARELLQENIMPDDVARSQHRRVWWIAKRIACTNQVVAHFKAMNHDLTQMMVGLGIAINVSMASTVDQSFNQAEQLATEVAELKRYIQQQHAASDDALHQVLDTLNARDDRSELASVVQSHAASNQLMQQLNAQMDVLQGLSARQVRALRRVASDCERSMRELGEWSQQLFDAMAQWESQLEANTSIVIGRIEETDARRQQAEEGIIRLVSTGFGNMTSDNRNVLQLLHLIFDTLTANKPLQSSSAEKTDAVVQLDVVDGGHVTANKPAPPSPARNTNVVEFNIDDMEIKFNDESLLGEGGGGKVYWGRLFGHLPEDRNEIAFKQLALPSLKSSSGSSRGGRGRGRGGRGAATVTTSRGGSPAVSTGSPSSASIALTGSSLAEEALRMLRREARISWRLNGSQQCVKLHGICLEPAGLVYEYCNWGTLQDLLWRPSWDDNGVRRFEGQKQLSLENKISCVAQLLQGLTFLHSKGFVHRDLKSTNCLVHNLGTEEEPVFVFKLSDYGSARTIADFVRSSTLTMTVESLKQNGGTLRWLAPERRSPLNEQQRRCVESHPAVDMWALGCVIGEVFLELPPFPDYSDSSLARLPADALPFAVATLIDPIKPLLNRCCEPKPERRASLEEVQYLLWPRACAALSRGDAAAKSASNSDAAVTGSPTSFNLSSGHFSATVQGSPTAPSSSGHVVCISAPPAVEDISTFSSFTSALQWLETAHNASIDQLPIALSIMRKFQTSSEVQASACKIVAMLALSRENRMALVNTPSIELVVNAMKHHNAVSEVQERACVALRNLALNAKGKQSVATAGGVDSILAAMMLHRQAAQVQEQACWALWDLSMDAGNQKRIAAAGGIEAIVTAMTDHPSMGIVQIRACGALKYLAASWENRNV